MAVGVVVPIPILSEKILRYTAVRDEDIFAPIVDCAVAYTQRKPDIFGEVRYSGLWSGEIEVEGKKMPTISLSSYSKAVEIASTLLRTGEILLNESLPHCPEWKMGYSSNRLMKGQ